MNLRPSSVIAAVVVLLATVVAAQDTVRLQILPGDRVRGTIRPADETERLLVDLPADAVLRVVARARGGPRPTLALLSPTNAELTAGTSDGARTRLSHTIETTGVHAVRISGDGASDGDYTLRVRSRPRTAFRVSSETDVDAAATADVPFAAPEGAELRAVVRSRGGSGVVPVDPVLVGPDGEVDVLDVRANGGKLKLRGVRIPATGDYTLRFTNAGDAGAWKAALRLKPGRETARDVDIRDGALLGTFGGVQAVFGQAATPTAAAQIVPDDGALNLAATQVVVPAGAVTSPTVVTVAEIEPFFVDDATFPAGQAVRLEPAGTQFEEDVVVSLPFLAQSFDDPEGDLLVVRRDEETGEVEVLPGPFEVDVDAAVVTFPTSEFSSFQAVSRADRPVKGTFLEIEVRPQLDVDGGSLTVGTNLVHGDFGPRSGNPADRGRSRHTLTWRAAGPGPAEVRVDVDEAVEQGRFLVSTDESVVLETTSGSRAYRRGRSSNGLAWAGDRAQAPQLSALLRRSIGTPTPGALSGAWHVFVLEANAVVREDETVTVRLVGQALQLDVAADGSATARRVVRQIAVHDAPDGDWRVLGDREAPVRGSLRPAEATGDDAYGAVLAMDVGLARFLTDMPLFPVLSGDLLVGTAGAEDASSGAVRLVVLVRTSNGADRSALTGRSIVAAGGFRVGGAGGAEQADAATALLVEATRSRDGGVRGDGRYVRADRGALPIEIPAAFDGTWKLRPDGTLKESQPLRVGALTPRGELYVDADFRDGRIEIGFGLPARDE